MKTYEQLSNAIMNDSGNNNNNGSTNSSTLCRFFFQSGYCRNGDSCKFSHDSNGRLSRGEALKTIPCPYYASGSCRFGERCELLHEEIKNSDEVCGICLENTIEKGRKYGILSL